MAFFPVYHFFSARAVFRFLSFCFFVKVCPSPLVSLSIFPVMDRYISNFTKEYVYVYPTLYL